MRTRTAGPNTNLAQRRKLPNPANPVNAAHLEDWQKESDTGATAEERPVCDAPGTRPSNTNREARPSQIAKYSQFDYIIVKLTIFFNRAMSLPCRERPSSTTHLLQREERSAHCEVVFVFIHAGIFTIRPGFSTVHPTFCTPGRTF
jgi:hypothetical protein